MSDYTCIFNYLLSILFLLYLSPNLQMMVKNTRNSLHALGCVMTLDLLINSKVNPNSISCGRISYEVGTLSNESRGRGKLLLLFIVNIGDDAGIYLWLM